MPERITVAQLVLGQLDRLHLEAIGYLRTARELHQLEQSDYTRGQLKAAEGLVVAYTTFKSRLPKTWRKIFVDLS